MRKKEWKKGNDLSVYFLLGTKMIMFCEVKHEFCICFLDFSSSSSTISEWAKNAKKFILKSYTVCLLGETQCFLNWAKIFLDIICLQANTHTKYTLNTIYKFFVALCTIFFIFSLLTCTILRFPFVICRKRQ